MAREAWAEAGLTDVIELRIAPAIETLRALPADEEIDLVFIDADKPGYGAYFDELLPRVRTNGLLLVDNTLWSGRVVDAAENRCPALGLDRRDAPGDRHVAGRDRGDLLKAQPGQLGQHQQSAIAAPDPTGRPAVGW